LNWIDLIMAAVLLSFVIRGLMRGFFRELFSLVGLFLGLWIALLKFIPLGEWLQKRVPLTEPLPFHLAFLAIFLGVSLVASLVGYLLHKTAKGIFIGWLDAVAGLGFGFVKGVMILTVLLFFLLRHSKPPPSQRLLNISTLFFNNLCTLTNSLAENTCGNGSVRWRRTRFPPWAREGPLGIPRRVRSHA
jgi:uncharacterized membrane protein required for colicin V production